MAVCKQRNDKDSKNTKKVKLISQPPSAPWGTEATETLFEVRSQGSSGKPVITPYPLSKKAIHDILKNLNLNFKNSAIEKIKKSVRIFFVNQYFLNKKPSNKSAKTKLENLSKSTKKFLSDLRELDQIGITKLSEIFPFYNEVFSNQDTLFQRIVFFLDKDLEKTLKKINNSKKQPDLAKEQLITQLAEIYQEATKKEPTCYWSDLLGKYEGKAFEFVFAIFSNIKEIESPFTKSNLFITHQSIGKACQKVFSSLKKSSQES